MQRKKPQRQCKFCDTLKSFVQYLMICGGVLEEFLNLMLAMLKLRFFNQEVLFAIRHVFDWDCILHKLNFTIPEETLQKIFTKGTK